jgi:hypothetical protein
MFFEKIFVAACEAYKNTIDSLPLDSAGREAYADGLSDGVRFALESVAA